jgi:hypothetical protein
MQLTDTQLETLRSQPQQTTLDLFIFQPETIFQAQINDPSITKGARTITYNNSTGSYLNIEEGMTMLVGTSVGQEDIGRIRVRSATGTYIKVSENSNIKWENGKYLTVLKFWEAWPVFPRLIQNPANQEDVIFYKDYDIAYVNQNNFLGTFVNAGCHQPVFLENGTGTVYYSATGTTNLVGSALTYDWNFDGGTPSGSSAYTPGYVYYTAPGDYVTRLIVTAANGTVDKTYRYISVKNKIGEGTNTPIVRWTMRDLTGSRDEGGYSAEFTVYDDIPVYDGAVVMLKANDWYGNTNQSFGGNAPKSETVFFVGFIEKGSIHYSYDRKYFTFTASNISLILKQTTGFSIFVESKEYATKWYELMDMDCRRAIYHFLRWHTTALNITDFKFNGTDYKIQYFDADRGSLFDAIDNLLRGTLIGSLCSDRQGTLYGEVHPKAYDNPTGTFTPVMDITKRDYKDRPNIEYVVYDNQSYLELGGIAYSGASTGTFAAVLSGAPGSAPSFHGAVEKTSGLAVGGQPHINQLSGNLWANDVQQYPTMSLDMAIAARNLDIAPYEVISVHIPAEDNVLGEPIDKLYVPQGFAWSYNAREQKLSQNINLEGVVSGNPGDTITIPVETTEEWDGGFEIPSFPIPQIPTIPPIIDPTTVDNVVVLTNAHGIYYTKDFTSINPTWIPKNGGIPSTRYSGLVTVEFDGAGGLYTHDSRFVWYATSVDANWNIIFDAETDIGDPEGFPFPRAWYISALGVNREGTDVLIIGTVMVTIFGTVLAYPFYGNSGKVSRTKDTALTYSCSYPPVGFLTYNGTEWIYTLFRVDVSKYRAMRLPQNGAEELGYYDIPTVWSNGWVHCKSRQSKDVSVWMSRSVTDVFSVTTDGGVTYTPASGTPPPNTTYMHQQPIISNADGTIFLVGTTLGLYYSLDSGSSWLTGPGAPGATLVNCVWHFGDNAFIYVEPNAIWFTPDITDVSPSYADKIGNLLDIFDVIGSDVNIRAMRHYN